MRRRVALVTGGSDGIGYEIAKAFVREGMEVEICARNAVRLEMAKQSLAEALQQPKQLGATIADVRSDEEVRNLISQILVRRGQIDILVNNAGRGGGGPTISTDEKLWYDIVDTNLHGVFRVTVETLRRGGMLERKWGRIINIASTAGKQGVPFAAAYTASKHGVVGFTKSLAFELAKTGVTVNAICPGFVESQLAVRAREAYSEIWEMSPEEVKKRNEARIPRGKYVLPPEVAPMALYLASETSESVVGQAFNICGGLGNY